MPTAGYSWHFNAACACWTHGVRHVCCVLHKHSMSCTPASAQHSSQAACADPSTEHTLAASTLRWKYVCMYWRQQPAAHHAHRVTPPALDSNQGMRSCQIEPPRKAALGCGHSTERRRKACARTRGHTHTYTFTHTHTHTHPQVAAVLFSCWHAGRKVAINLCGQVTLCADEIQGGRKGTT